MSENFEASPDTRAEGGAWIVWAVLIAVAIALYEIAQQPALLGVTMALKFAWGDARTGWWIRSRDTVRVRGAAHFRLYLGYGFWKAAGAAFVLSILFATIDNLVRKPAAAPPPQNQMFFKMVVGSVFGSLTLAVIGSIACFSAFWPAARQNFKLWLNSRVAADRVRDRWPPTQGETNAIVWMGYATGLALMFFFVIVLLSVFLALANQFNPAVLGLGLLITFMLVIFQLARFIDRGGAERRFRAHCPEEVWPDAS